MLETVYVDDNLEMLVLDSSYKEVRNMMVEQTNS